MSDETAGGAAVVRLDDAGIEGVVRDLIARGWFADAVQMLGKEARNLVSHVESDATALPCLCRHCAPIEFEAEAAGERFVRDFVVVARKSLQYWVPVDVAASPRELDRLRHAMRASVSERLRGLRKRARRRAAARRNGAAAAPAKVSRLINPLTGEPVT